MNRKVYLDGELGERFGKELTLNVNSFSDLLRLLQCNDPTFRDYLMECHEKGVGFFCKVGEDELTTEGELLMNFQEGDMYVSPVPAGSGDGLGKILAAIALVVVAIYAPQILGALGYTGSAATFQMVAYGMAASFAIAGIAQMMAPDPSTDTPDGDQDRSYLFQGSGQTILEGDPVPVLYGRLRVPGRTIDMDIRNQRSSYIQPDGASGYKIDLDANSSSTLIPDTGSEVIPHSSVAPATDQSGGINGQVPGQIVAGNITIDMANISRFVFAGGAGGL